MIGVGEGEMSCDGTQRHDWDRKGNGGDLVCMRLERMHVSCCTRTVGKGGDWWGMCGRIAKGIGSGRGGVHVCGAREGGISCFDGYGRAVRG